MTIPAASVSIIGDAASQFSLASPLSADIILAPGATLPISISFGATAIGTQSATLTVTTNDPLAAPISVALRGLGTAGEQGSLEPSLQRILDTYQIGVQTGDSDPAESTLDMNPTGQNDEVVAPLFMKAGPGTVSIVPIAAYTGVATPALTLGYYTKASPQAAIYKKQLYTVPAADVQTMTPHVTGSSSFDPGLATFGLYSTWIAQRGRTVYSQDSRNTFISADMSRMFKVYPLKDENGTVVPNAFVIGNEEAFNHDYQDAVYIIRNVVPVQVFPPSIPTSQVAGLTLVNADTNTDIGPLTNGQTIDFSQLGTTHLSIRASINGKALSVKYVDGAYSFIDNAAPFTIKGEVVGKVVAWTPTVGIHTLVVTPYAATKATGVAGIALTVNFTVQLSPPPVVIPPVVPPVIPPIVPPVVPPVTPPDVTPVSPTTTDPISTTPPTTTPPVVTTPPDSTVPPVRPTDPITTPPATTPTDMTSPTPTPPPTTPPVTTDPVTPPPTTPVDPPVVPPVVIPPIVTPPVVTPPVVVAPPAPVIYQAEQATLSGAIVGKENAGYTGAGYADFQNATGDSVRWNVTNATAGSVQLTFRYANGGTANRPLSLKINGVVVTASLAFAPTGSWTTWKTVTVTVQLVAGTNTIALTSTGSNGANIDSLTVG